MAQVSVKDVEELERFYRRLKDFDRVLEGEFSRIRSDWSRTESAWNDQKGRRFGEDLHEVTRGIDRYLKEAPEYEAYLSRLIKRVHDVLDTTR